MISKSAITPSFIGRMATMLPGVRPEHLLRLLADRQHLLAAARVLLHRDHRGLVGDDALAADVDERVRGPQIDGQIAREEGVQPVEHRGGRRFPGKVQATGALHGLVEHISVARTQTVALPGRSRNGAVTTACLVAAGPLPRSRPRARAVPPCASRAATTWLLVLTSALAAHAAEPSIPFEEFTLPNGLRVILSEDHRAPQVAVNVWYHVGAANQRPGKSGFAHLFEHMMFSGSEHVPQPDQVLAAIGAQPTEAPTSTAPTTSRPFPPVQLPTALWLESDRMGFLLPTLDQKKLETQRDVVSNELRQRYREPALRPCLPHPLRHPLPQAAPLLSLRHRGGRGDPGREPGGRAGLLPGVLPALQRHPGPGGRLRPARSPGSW